MKDQRTQIPHVLIPPLPTVLPRSSAESDVFTSSLYRPQPGSWYTQDNGRVAGEDVAWKTSGVASTQGQREADTANHSVHLPPPPSLPFVYPLAGVSGQKPCPKTPIDKVKRHREQNKISQRACRARINRAIDDLRRRAPHLGPGSHTRTFILEETVRYIDKLHDEVAILKAKVERAYSTTGAGGGLIVASTSTTVDPEGQYGLCSEVDPDDDEGIEDPVAERNQPYWSSTHFYTVASDPEPYELFPQLFLPISPIRSTQVVQKWYAPISPGVVWLQ